ncbi:MAG: DNA/RNA non-specific endonuclease [Flavitalea sp.]
MQVKSTHTKKKKSLTSAQQDGILVDVFISYSRKDIKIARKFYELLTSEGFAVWFDEKIYVGTIWEDMLMSHLLAAKFELVLWTGNSAGSEWVKKEAAVAQALKRLVPVTLDNTGIPEAWQTLQNVMLDNWKPEEPHPKLEQLLTGISKLAPPSRVDNVRPGFVSDALGVEVEMPSITGVGDEFRYLHFSVVMNPARRLPWYVAANLQPYNKEVERGDKWMPDPLLPASFQPGNEHYRNTDYDRGHIISPRSVAWGDLRQAQLANRQSFFWTNTAPQLAQMNQGWWLKIEEWERAITEQYGKAISFGGPVLKADDPALGETEQLIGRIKVKQNFLVPQSFWKVVLVFDNELAIACFLLNQVALLKSNAAADLSIKTHIVSLKEIEKATGLGFSLTMHQAKSIKH